MKRVLTVALALSLIASGTVTPLSYAAEPAMPDAAVVQENDLSGWVQKVRETLTPAITPDIPLRETADHTDLLTLWNNECYNYKVIRNLPTAYAASGWDAYTAQGSIVVNWTPSQLTEDKRDALEQLVQLRHNLKQVKPYAESAWFIWDADMPTEKAVSEQDFVGAEDNADFKPFLVPYLQKDQSNVKGNMIIVSGGGYSSRANPTEGYPTAERFYDLGYNCFVLQRRVAPYSTKDIWADMQRSIRYVRAKIDELGLGASDCIIGTGFSGGSATVLGAIAEYYGDVQPAFDGSYTPDYIDSLNSDLDIALLIYGPNYTSTRTFEGLVTENPNLPAMVLVAGADDTADTDNMTLYRSVEGKTVVEMYSFAYAPHGFGTGVPGTNSTYWIELSDSFIEKTRVLNNSNIIEVAEKVQYMEFPAGFTKYQSYSVDLSFGPVDVTLVTTDTEDKYLMYFTAFGSEQILGGVLLDETPIMRYSRTGFFGSNNAELYAAHTDNWTPIPQ